MQRSSAAFTPRPTAPLAMRVGRLPSRMWSADGYPTCGPWGPNDGSCRSIAVRFGIRVTQRLPLSAPRRFCGKRRGVQSRTNRCWAPHRRKFSRARPIRGWRMDFADAREHVGIGRKPWGAASDLARFSTGVKTHVALVNTQPFGPPRAPAPFGFVAIVLRDLPPPTPEFLFWPKWATFSPRNKLPLRAPLR